MGKGLKGIRDKVFLMTKTWRCAWLDESLRRLQTAHLDLWQSHGVSFENDPDLFIRGMEPRRRWCRPRNRGRYASWGFTGHKDPGIHLKMLATDFPFYSIQMRSNVFDSQFRSFEQQVLPELTRRGIAPLGMKPMRGHGYSILKGAMRLPVAVTITGMEKPEVLQQNLRIARGFQAMTASEMQNVRDRVKVYAADGRFELYKLSLKFDNPEARTAHGFPLDVTSVEVKEMMGATENTGRPWAAATWGRPKI